MKRLLCMDGSGRHSLSEVQDRTAGSFARHLLNVEARLHFGGSEIRHMTDWQDWFILGDYSKEPLRPEITIDWKHLSSKAGRADASGSNPGQDLIINANQELAF